MLVKTVTNNTLSLGRDFFAALITAFTVSLPALACTVI